MGHKQSYKWTYHHTLTQNHKAQVYGSSPHLYGTQLFYFYAMWDFTLHLYSNNYEEKFQYDHNSQKLL